MDDVRFDRMARVFGSGPSRRHLLAGVLATLPVGLHESADISARKKKKKCKKGKTRKCGKKCIPLGTCCKSADCQPGQVCDGKGGQCRCTTASCVGCCSGDTCLAGNAPAACGTGGAACGVCAPGQVCPNKVCSNGALAVGAACNAAQPGACVSGKCGCNNNLCACRQANCVGPGAPCAGSLDCCQKVCDGNTNLCAV